MIASAREQLAWREEKAYTGVVSGFRVPAWLHGSFKDVNRAAGRFVTAVCQGRSPVASTGSDWVPVESTPGLLVLDRIHSNVPASEPQFHLDLPWRRLFDKARGDADVSGLAQSAVDVALGEAWSFVALVGGQHRGVGRTAAAQLRVLDAARKHWPSLTAVGPRYSTGREWGSELAALPTRVGLCLGRQGATLSPGTLLTAAVLEAILRDLPGFRVRNLLEAGDVDAALRVVAAHRSITLVSLAEHFLAVGLEAAVCDVVAKNAEPDPHGIVRGWLAGRGDLTRTVR